MHLIGRRNFLSGLGLGVGASLLGPMARGLVRTALGAPAAKRFIVITHACGWIEPSYTCVARSETDFDLGPSYEALKPFKKDMVILSKFYNPHTNYSGLHGNGWGTLAVTPISKMDTLHPGTTCCGEHYTPGSVTLDRFISKQAPFSADPFPLTALGPSWAGGALVPSGDGPGQPFPAFSTPTKAYDAWFVGGAKLGDTTGGAEKILAQDKSVLDFMRADIARMNARVAPPERVRLDQYLDGLRGVERQLSRLGPAPATCMTPVRPKPANTQAEMAAFVDVAFAAQMCGLSHVSHVSYWGVDGPQINFSWLNLPNNEHDMHHGLEKTSNAGILDPAIMRMDGYILSKVAQMIENLSKVPDGAGTMLDSSLVMYVNAGGGKHHQGHNNHAVLLAGRAGGALKTGRYLSYAAKEHAISDLYVSVANMMGAPIKTFGDPTICKGPLPGVA